MLGVRPLRADGVVLASVGEAPPGAVMLAAILQVLLAAMFLIMPVLVLRHGSHAQAAAEAEVVRQGFPAEVLAKNRVHFDEGTAGLVLPVAIALGLGACAALNVAGNEIGRILTWILQPILLVGGGLVAFRQVTAARFIESGFDRSGDPILATIDVRAFVEAATGAFPRWFVFMVRARFVLVTLGWRSSSCCSHFRPPASTSAEGAPWRGGADRRTASDESVRGRTETGRNERLGPADEDQAMG